MDDFYEFEKEAKVLKEGNAEFYGKFSTEIDKLSKEDALRKEYGKILSHLDITAFICPLTKNIFK